MRTPKIASHVENLIPYNRDTEVLMNTLTINLPDERFLELEEKSAQLNITPEEFALRGITELLSLPDEKFQKIMEEVLEEYDELYQRLAA